MPHTAAHHQGVSEVICVCSMVMGTSEMSIHYQIFGLT